METKKIIEVDSVESLSNDDAIFVNSNNSLKQILKSNLTTDGGYYSPSVDSDGNLSWTASKTGMPDVPGTNIKGPKGDAGATGSKGDTGAQGPKGDIGATGAQGPKGEKGDKGDTGAAGPAGQSAYAAAQAGGYTDTQANFYADLAAMQGLASALAAI